MARHAPVVEHAGNTVTVIAPTAEEAMALVGDAGPGFRTTSIGKVRRGGLGGFFATEMVRVVAEAPPNGPAMTSAGGRPVAPLGAGSLQLATADDLIASLCGSDGPFAGRLAAGLQRSLHEPPATAAVPASDPIPTPANIGAADFWRSEPAPCGLTDESPQRQKSPDAPAGVWSAAALEAVGLPASLVARVAGVRPHDEVTWNAALMLAVRDWCGAELPSGAVLAGPDCGDLAAALHVPVVDSGAVMHREGSVAAPMASAADLCAAVGERPVHLVVGGRWRHLATVRPATVSAAACDDLVEAVRAAVAWDAPLGWVVQGETVTRIDPFVVAAHVRALLSAAGPPSQPMAAVAARRPAAPRTSRAGAEPTARSGAGRGVAAR